MQQYTNPLVQPCNYKFHEEIQTTVYMVSVSITHGFLYRNTMYKYNYCTALLWFRAHRKLGTSTTTLCRTVLQYKYINRIKEHCKPYGVQQRTRYSCADHRPLHLLLFH
eukprot:Lankesteria_metandrocarpae@DN1857_c0_g1_i2.p1